MLEQDVAVRAYVESGDPRYLDSHGRYGTRFDEQLELLRRKSAGGPRAGDVARTEAAATAWQRWAADMGRRVDAAGGPIEDPAVLDEGARLFAVFGARQAELDSGLEADYAVNGFLAKAAGVVGAVALLGGSFVVGLVLLLLAGRVRRLGLDPLQHLVDAADRIAGDGGDSIPYEDRQDEIGALARALRGWQDASRERETLGAQAPVGICRLDGEGRLVSVNRRLAEMLGRPVEQLKGRPFTDFAHPDELPVEQGGVGRMGGGGIDRLQVEARAIRPDGSVMWCSATVGPLRDRTGRLEGSVAIVEDITARKQQTERAARIQRELWPQRTPSLRGYQLAGSCLPAQDDVAGDLYDWIARPDGQLDLTVADVMGKGIGAALAMATLRAALRSAPADLGPAARLSLAAESMALGADDEGLFVTVFLCRLEPRSGELRYVDAGHGYCLIRRAGGELVTLTERSLPLGVGIGGGFREGRTRLERGDTLLVYSDGLVERGSESVPVETFTAELETGDADAVVRRLLRHVPPLPSDDVTVLVLHRTADATVGAVA